MEIAKLSEQIELQKTAFRHTFLVPDWGQPQTGTEVAERRLWYPTGGLALGLEQQTGRKPREGDGFGQRSLGVASRQDDVSYFAWSLSESR